jgi:hypothetical protein
MLCLRVIESGRWLQCLHVLTITFRGLAKTQKLNVKTVIELVLRLALLLSSEGTSDACQPAMRPSRRASGLLNSTLAFRPHLYGKTSSPDPFNLPFNKYQE